MKIQNIGILLGVLAAIGSGMSSRVKQKRKEKQKFKDVGMPYSQSYSHSQSKPMPRSQSWSPVMLTVSTSKYYKMKTFPLSNKTTDLSFLDERLYMRKNLVIITPGWLSGSDESWVNRMASAYLKQRDVNVFTTDWSHWAKELNYYAVAEIYTHYVASYLATFLRDIIDQLQVKPRNIHLIGFSLGAHISGFVGKRVPDIKRITGLDPAGPLFRDSNVPKLSKTDAEYVDVIHTDDGFFGNGNVVGRVNLVINGGVIQYTCSSVTYYLGTKAGHVCSHIMAHDYFTESIENQDCKFVAASTKERAMKVVSRDFDPSIDTVLGLDTFKYKMEGEYYIYTHDTFLEPHCRY